MGMRGMGMGGMGRRRGGGGVPIQLIFLALQYLPRLLEIKPMATMAFGGVLLGNHLGLLRFGPMLFLADFSRACLSPPAVLFGMELWRLFTSLFLLSSDGHMYWALSSLAAKGLSMEPRVGTESYAAVLVLTALLSGVIYTILCWIGVPSLFGLESGWNGCHVGPDMVLFALKPVSLALGGNEASRIFGMPLPGGAHAAWVELVVVYIWHHNASMFANICGIFAGYLYCLLTGLTIDVPLVGRVDPAALGLGAAPLRRAARGFTNPLPANNFFGNLFGGGAAGGDGGGGGGAGAWGGAWGGGGGGGGTDWGANTAQQRAGQRAGGQTTGGRTSGNTWGSSGANAWGGASGSAAPRDRAAPSPAPAPSPARPSSAPPPDYQARYTNGTAVRVFGLVSASHHNGKIGKVVNFDALTARYHVMLGPGTTVALKDGNILPAGGEGEGLRQRGPAGPVELD
jgi:membrane associated rhomboid family serine protease